VRNIIFTSVFTALAVLAAPAVAAPAGCWSRQYDAGHLKQNPAQVVEASWLNFIWQGSTLTANLSVYTANQGHVRGTNNAEQVLDQVLLCWQDEGRKNAWSCSVECDGGMMEITRMDGKVLEFRTNYLMVGDTDRCGGAVDLAEHPGQSVTYRLYRAPDGECETN